MGKGRLEAFSDGVIAIILTITVLEVKVPHGSDLAALSAQVPVLLSYTLSFVFIGIYWNNHHHMLHATRKVNGWVLWANLHLLFWLSLVPVATGWLGEYPNESLPASLYGVLLFMAGIAYTLLSRTLIAADHGASTLAAAVGRSRKGELSQILYLSGIGIAFFRPWISELLYVTVACLWFVPNPRIERMLEPPPSAAA